ncbi:hypothetical protein A7A76_07665 [Lysobacter enzymogenes]|uniref:hypothetical protein n=1 Tax=Lysobacter enzymogenes TaxID=69 RepID=UPI0019D0EA23|nr:hypothetical protein [Lysobacter enzymogenes]MBN7138970.1 hypothetical protein [Lysobacter enzymogenes]
MSAGAVDFTAPEVVCAVLQPLYDIGDVRELNGPSGRWLAALIHPRDAGDLTVREVLDLLKQVDAMWDREVGGGHV